MLIKKLFYKDISISKRLNLLLREGISKINPLLSWNMRSICILLTYNCNLRCKMCPVWGKSGFAYKISKEELNCELTLNELKRVIDELTFYNPIIILSGGEPLLYKDWYELAKYIKLKKMRTVLQTNGMLMNEYKNEIIECIDSLAVSIDGKEKIHDEIRGVAGSFNKIIENMEQIDSLKKEKKAYLPTLDINFTISAFNYNKLIELVNWVDNLKIDINSITFMHLFFIHKDAFEYHEKYYKNILELDKTIYGFDNLPYGLNPQELDNEIRGIKNNKYKFAIHFEPEINKEKMIKYYDINSPLKNINIQGKCHTPWSEGMLLPDGKLLNCICNVIGNIKEDSIKNLWNNEKAKAIRKIISSNGSIPICRNCRFRYM